MTAAQAGYALAAIILGLACIAAALGAGVRGGEKRATRFANETDDADGVVL